MTILELIKITHILETMREQIKANPELGRDVLLDFANWSIGTIPELVAECRWMQEKHKDVERLLKGQAPREDLEKHIEVMGKGRQ